MKFSFDNIKTNLENYDDTTDRQAGADASFKDKAQKAGQNLSSTMNSEKSVAPVAKSGDLKGRLKNLDLDPMHGAMSDGNLKEALSKNIDILEDYGKLSAYAYKYNNTAHQLYGNEKAVDNKVHVGPMAQELEKTPSTSASVSTNADGYKEVDTRKLSLTNAAAIAELVKRVDELEKFVGRSKK